MSKPATFVTPEVAIITLFLESESRSARVLRKISLTDGDQAFDFGGVPIPLGSRVGLLGLCLPGDNPSGLRLYPRIWACSFDESDRLEDGTVPDVPTEDAERYLCAHAWEFFESEAPALLFKYRDFIAEIERLGPAPIQAELPGSPTPKRNVVPTLEQIVINTDQGHRDYVRQAFTGTPILTDDGTADWLLGGEVVGALAVSKHFKGALSKIMGSLSVTDRAILAELSSIVFQSKPEQAQITVAMTRLAKALSAGRSPSGRDYEDARNALIKLDSLMVDIPERDEGKETGRVFRHSLIRIVGTEFYNRPENVTTVTVYPVEWWRNDLKSRYAYLPDSFRSYDRRRQVPERYLMENIAEDSRGNATKPGPRTLRLATLYQWSGIERGALKQGWRSVERLLTALESVFSEFAIDPSKYPTLAEPLPTPDRDRLSPRAFLDGARVRMTCPQLARIPPIQAQPKKRNGSRNRRRRPTD